MLEQFKRQSLETQGIIFMILSQFFFAANDGFVKYILLIHDNDISFLGQIVFIRGIFATIFIGLILFAKKQLELKTIPTIKIQNDREGLKTTANYDYTKENKIIKVCAMNRALVDVCRSIAHELVHHKQREEGKPADGRDGSPVENEANAMAGTLMRKFRYVRPELYLER